MKLLKILLPLAALFLFACRKSPGIDNAIIGSTNNPGGLLSASIDGKPWIASLRFASIMNGFITISGTDSTDRTIAISLNDTIVGPYVLGQKTVSVATYTESNMYLEYFSTNDNKDASLSGGNVVVTSIDRVNKTITGTFTLNLYNDSARYKKTVTEGNFINLPYITELPLAKVTDTFSVQIDGVSWAAKSISAGIVAGQLLVKGSEQDDSRSVSIYLPQNFPTGGYGIFLPDNIWGAYDNKGQSCSSLQYINQPGIVEEIGSYPGLLYMIEDDPATRRLRASFDFQAVGLTGSPSVQLSKGYFSVQY